MFKWFGVIVIQLAILVSGASAQAIGAKEIDIDMFAGEVIVLGTFNVDRVAIGDGGVIRVEVKEGGELIVIAQSAGSSSLRLWHENGGQSAYNFRVSKSDPKTRVRMQSMVRMNVKMVEIRKSAIKDLGFNWGKSVNGPAFGVAGDAISEGLFRIDGPDAIEGLPLKVKPFSTYFGLSSQITSQINFLASNGDAMTLAEPALSCINGGSAKFLAGGEIPYPVTGANGQVSVQFKEYGIKLDISPLVDDKGNIVTSILSEISQVDPAVTVLGAPGILTRRTQTQVNVTAGETIVLSGLLSSENSKDIEKIPVIGDLPILGNLFKSKNFRNNVTELIIFVTPEVVDPDNLNLSDREMALYKYSVKKHKEATTVLNVELME